jgi:ribosomal protein S18 acetylase RimI-like enzyme
MEIRRDLAGIEPAQLGGFFVGWPNPPSAETFLRLLQGSSHVALAFDGGRVVGFITAVSDGVLAAYIPLLEVLPEYQGRGVGRKLVQDMLEQLSDFYMVDLICDENLRQFYERLGLKAGRGMMLRNYARQSGWKAALRKA